MQSSCLLKGYAIELEVSLACACATHMGEGLLQNGAIPISPPKKSVCLIAVLQMNVECKPSRYGMAWHRVYVMSKEGNRVDRLPLQKHNRNSTRTMYLQIFTSPFPSEYSVNDISCIGIRAMSTTHIDSTQQRILFKFINVNDLSSATPA